MPTVVALVTAYQRPQELQQTLWALKKQKKSAALDVSLYITLDLSPDLAPVVQSLWPKATILLSSKPLYWGGGTNLAWRAAQKLPPDAYLLLNQDTTLYPDALSTLWELQTKTPTPCLVAGKTYDPKLHQISYGGWEFVPGPLQPIAKFHPKATESSMANGNILLVPESIRKKVGDIDDKLPHLFGDFDYTLRAKKLGIHTLLPAQPLGECQRQPKNYSEAHPWSRLTHPTQLSLGPKLRFLWRHQKPKVPAQVLKTFFSAFFPPRP